MSQVVVCAESVATGLITGAFPQLEPFEAGSKSECAKALVSGAAIEFLVVQRDLYAPEDQAFLSSIKRHFPRLEIVVIAPGGSIPPPDGCHFIDGSLKDQELVGRIATLAQATRAKDQRHGIRYDWPLGGRLLLGGREMPCKVRSFSSSGAFLDMGEAFQADAAHEAAVPLLLRVEFLNSHITVKCDIVRQQGTDRETPAGYGVRFLEFSSQAQEFCERIVRDAVMRALLYPEEERQIPSLTEEDLVIPGFGQM